MGHKEWEYASGAEKWKNVLGSLYGSVTAALATSSASARALATYTSASFTGYVVNFNRINEVNSRWNNSVKKVHWIKGNCLFLLVNYLWDWD